MKRTVLLIAAVAAVLAIAGIEQAFAQEDTIVIDIAGKHTKVERVKIGRETYRTVRYKVGTGVGTWQEEPTEKVIEIIHGDSPNSYMQAESALKDGNWSDAISGFRNCIKNERKEWVQIYSQFFLAEALRMWGQSDPSKLTDAVKEFEVFLSKNSDHRFVPDAHYGKAMAASGAGLGGKAKASFDELAGGKYGSNWEVRGQYGSIQLAGSSASESQISSLISKARRLGMNDIVAAARLSLAKALLDNKKYREAMKMYKDIVSDPEGVGKGVLASAHNGLGDCYSNLASSQDDTKRALFEYLKVVVLYASAHKEYVDALKKSISMLEKVGGDEYKKRAEELKKEYEKATKR